MTALQQETRMTLARRLARMEQPVRLLVFGGTAWPRCARTRAVVQALVGVAPKIRVECHDPDDEPHLMARYGIELLPAIALLTDGVEIADTGLRWYGTPGDAELRTLVNAIVLVSLADSGAAGYPSQGQRPVAASRSSAPVLRAPLCPVGATLP